MSSSDDGPLTRTVLPDDQQPGGPAKRPRPLRSLLIVLTVVALLLGAIAIANRGGGSGSKSGGDHDATATQGTAPGGHADPTAPTGVAPVAGSTNGIPKGFAHTQQGAQSAAANYAVALGSGEMFKVGDRHRIVDAVADASVMRKFQADLDKAYSTSALKKVGLDAHGDAPSGETFVSRVIPVGTKTEKYGSKAATVSVWTTSLFGLAGTGSENPVASGWTTYTFDLHWAGDWKVLKNSQQEGPAPVDGDVPASGADTISSAVKDYGGFTYGR